MASSEFGDSMGKRGAIMPLSLTWHLNKLEVGQCYLVWDNPDVIGTRQTCIKACNNVMTKHKPESEFFVNICTGHENSLLEKPFTFYKIIRTK
jgi:hypothetical protein